MPAFSSNWMLIPIHSGIGSVWRLFYWLSVILILIFDLWSVRFKDWGILKISSRQKIKHKDKMLVESYDCSNTVNLIPLLLFHSTYFLVSFVSLLSVNYRPIVTESNIGLHNALHHNYVFTVPEFHHWERRYLHRMAADESFKGKGGINCGFWGQGRSQDPTSHVEGFFHKLLSFFSWKEKYYGSYFKETDQFLATQKITDYGVGSLMIDRFFVESSFYLLFALIGLLASGMVYAKLPPKNEKSEYDASGKNSENTVPSKQTLQETLLSAGKPGIGRFFQCARFIVAYSLSLNLFFSSALEIRNYIQNTNQRVKIIHVSFGVACCLSLLILIELRKLILVAIKGNPPEEI